MKKKTTTLALFLALSALATSCQKEFLESPVSGTPVEQVYAENRLVYSIDGQVYSASFKTPEEKDAFFLQLMAVARQGHVVTIGSRNATQAMTKEKVIHKTTDANDAAEWCEKMENLGYEVTITVNEETGIYTCIAIK